MPKSDPLSFAIDASSQGTWPRDVQPLNHSKDVLPYREQEALSVTGQTPEGLAKANSHDNHTPSVAGRTLEGNSNKANSFPPDIAQPPASQADLGSTVVFSVNSSFSIQGTSMAHPLPS